MNEPGFLIAFGIGTLSFLSPCTLPILPGYFSYLAGVAREENGVRKRHRVLIASLAFVAGFSLVLIILGAAASAIGQLLLKDRKLWQKIGGIVIVFFGMQTMGIIKKIGPISKPRKENAFFAGASFALGWTPCIGPILGSILILASQTQTVIHGVGLLISYALGLSLPMILSGFFLGQLKFLKNQYVPFISGSILITLGFLLFFGYYGKLTIWTSQVFRFLNIPIY